MKIREDNTLKLARNERRLGNFVIKDEENHVKVMDINSIFTHRTAKSTPIGMFLKQCYDALLKDESTGRGLGNWLACIFTVFSVVPDVEFLQAIYEASEACMKRHPEVYGAPAEPVSDEKDAEIIKEQQELAEFEQKVREVPDGDDSEK